MAMNWGPLKVCMVFILDINEGLWLPLDGHNYSFVNDHVPMFART